MKSIGAQAHPYQVGPGPGEQDCPGGVGEMERNVQPGHGPAKVLDLEAGEVRILVGHGEMGPNRTQTEGREDRPDQVGQGLGGGANPVHSRVELDMDVQRTLGFSGKGGDELGAVGSRGQAPVHHLGSIAHPRLREEQDR